MWEKILGVCMFLSSFAKGLSLPLIRSDKYSALIFEEQCALCGAEQKDGKRVLRHKVTKNIICDSCIKFIAS